MRSLTGFSGFDPEEDVVDEQLRRFLEEMTWHAIPAKVSGYIQSADCEALLQLAQEEKSILRMERGVGDFIVENTPLASLAQDEPPDQQVMAVVYASYSISSHRTVVQDPSFGVRQIVDMALKALSPGVNDTSTAVMCIDYLTTILTRLATRQIPSSLHYHNGDLRMIAKGPGFDSLLAESFDQIRRSAAGNVAIISRMLGSLETIAGQSVSERYRGALRDQVRWLAELAERTIEAPHDLDRTEERVTRTQKALAAGPAKCLQKDKNN